MQKLIIYTRKSCWNASRLGENDVLPDSDNATKTSVIKDKLGFKERVREWRMSAVYAESSSISGAESTSVSVW